MTSKISFDKPKPWRAMGIAAAILLLVAVLVGVALHLNGEPPVHVTQAPAGTPSPPHPSGSEPFARSAPSPLTPAPQARPPAKLSSLHSSEDEFRRLMASSDRRDHARAYLMAWECASEADIVRRNGRVPTIEDPRCQLAPGTWQDVEARKKGVIAAAQLGRPNGWFYLYAEEGPDGRLGAYSEAERDEWKRLVAETYTIALEAKDSAALGYEAVMQEAAGNYARAAQLYVASAAALARRTNQPYLQPEETLAQLRPKLSAADLNQAIVEGRKMAETVKAGELL